MKHWALPRPTDRMSRFPSRRTQSCHGPFLCNFPISQTGILVLGFGIPKKSMDSKQKKIHFKKARNFHQSITQSITQSLTHSINQSITQSINHSLNRSINQSLTHSINQSITQSINHSLNRSINQSINQSITQSINQSIDQSIDWLHPKISQPINYFQLKADSRSRLR